MAQPVIVADATAAGGAAVGPGERHGMRPYSRKAGVVKIVQSNLVLHVAALSAAKPHTRRLPAWLPSPREHEFDAILPNV
jgi:hypothetical protein